MDLSDKTRLYRIVRSRDKRYDGRFYCGVRTTGIYCRPVCPARPLIENILFFRSPAEAENAGYRPCLRCRPDLAPDSARWPGPTAVVGRVLTMIARGDADGASLGRLARRVGVSDRHLRRLFEEHVGASPLEVAASKRLHLAKHLLVRSNLPVTEVAFASGYRSVRRFNDAFKDRFRLPPSRVRSRGQGSPADPADFIRLEIPVIEPFDWEQLYGFLRSHAADGVEGFAGGKYRRSFFLGGAKGALEVGFEPRKRQLGVAVAISNAAYLREAIERVKDLFDARLNPHAHLADVGDGDAVGALYRGALGIRVPGAWDPFETAVRVILSQLVTTEQAGVKVKRLVERFGARIARPVFPECAYLFPGPNTLARADLRSLGVTRAREAAVRELSRLVLERKLDLSRSADIEKTKARLLAVEGIGPWTAEMIAMRCLGDTNAFPRTDLIVRRALRRHRVEKGDWSPWNAYIALTLWKKYSATLSKKRRRASAGR